MKSVPDISLPNVQAVYSGPEGQLWELIMGEQIHIGGLTSSIDLANRAAIPPQSTGVDLCCCSGAGMRFLLRFRNVASMRGVDATEKMVQLGRQRTAAENLSDRIQFVLADVCNSNLPTASSDFIWGEDAWCYVQDKPKLISEAARIVKPAGTIAFTDWVEGPTALSNTEAERFLRFMKFPNMQDLEGYRSLLSKNGCQVLTAHDTHRFAPCIDLYLNMLNTQLTYDALKIIGFDHPMMEALAAEMLFAQKLAHEGKLIQAMFVARKA